MLLVHGGVRPVPPGGPAQGVRRRAAVLLRGAGVLPQRQAGGAEETLIFVGSFLSGSATNRGLAFPPDGEITKVRENHPIKARAQEGGGFIFF